MQQDAVVTSRSLIDWAVRGRALPGEVESGDLHVIAPFTGGVLIAAMDGLGHGAEAAVAARLAAATLQERASAPVVDLVQRCHKALQKTRGAAISIASFSAEGSTMTWAGVGNVEAILFRAHAPEWPARESLLLQAGVVGYQMPPLRSTTLPVLPGDTLIFATDGVSSGFGQEPELGRSPGDLAADILRRHAKLTDDALVLVARYVGGPP